MAASSDASTAADGGAKPAVLVLDTNVVLDWLVFQDQRIAPLSGALESGTIRWVSCPRMREELKRTLAYPALSKWKPDSERTLTLFDRWSLQAPDPASPQASPLLCSDPDDQVFLELGLAIRADWLLTRDRAVLKLKARALRQGLRIGTPEAWAASRS